MRSGDSIEELRREVSMRKMIRRAIKEGFERIAVVFGTCHVPALMTPQKVKGDNQVRL